MKTPPSSRKLRGGYYTPQSIAEFLCRWAISDVYTTVLEPSCGDGIFLGAAAERLRALGAIPQAIATQLLGVELESSEAAAAVRRLSNLGIAYAQVHDGDFFSFYEANLNLRRFDAVVGNPPFIRYQNFADEHRKPAFELMNRAGLHPNRLTNAWMPFVVAATLLLKKGGRLALVIPAELLQVNYPAELRKFLSANYTRLTIFTFRRLVFHDIQQEVILLCGERGETDREVAWIRTIELTDLSDFQSHQHTDFEQAELKTMDHSTEKWTQYFLSTKELELIRSLRAHPKLSRLGDVASVDVGIVTGMNDFFVLTKAAAHRLRLIRYTKPMMTRSAQLKGTVLRNSDWSRALELGFPVLLLDLPRKAKADLGVAARRYVEYGEKHKFDKGYKCSIRVPWYMVPSVWVPDAFLLRQIHGYPKLIINRAKATCTDTIHRVRFKDPRDGERITTAFLNSLTFAFAEIIGRSYGGGVLELEPNEADALPIPLAGADCLDPNEADIHLRDDRDLAALLGKHDAILLGEALGISSEDIATLRHIWMKLRDRRIGRKVAPRLKPEIQMRLFLEKQRRYYRSRSGGRR